MVLVTLHKQIIPIKVIRFVPANETREGGGGRVFFTSTDQDGNFRVGGLFNVEQSTGVATLDADAFNIRITRTFSWVILHLVTQEQLLTNLATWYICSKQRQYCTQHKEQLKLILRHRLVVVQVHLTLTQLLLVLQISGQEITTTQ